MLDGKKLQFLRFTHHKTQKEVADFCGVSTRAIKAYEYGEYPPSPEVYSAYLNCLYGVGKPLKERPNKRGPKPKADKQQEVTEPIEE